MLFRRFAPIEVALRPMEALCAEEGDFVADVCVGLLGRFIRLT